MARTVFVVDDDQLVLEVTAAMLDDPGCDVVTASPNFCASADRNVDY